MAISPSLVKELREETGVGMMDCKRALEETNGNKEEAVKILRKKGMATAQKRAAKAASEGVIGSYIHAGGKVGVLLELNCETDFVAKTDDFQELLKDLSMQVAAANPRFVTPEDVTEEVLASEREIYRAQAIESGKPENIAEKIVEGKMRKFYEEACLMEQEYIKDTNMKVKDRLTEVIGKLGENIKVGRFVRFQMGENAS